MARILLFIFCLCLPGTAIGGGCDMAGVQAEPRTILGLYDSQREASLAESRLHRFAELPLNHMGYVLRYLDVSQADLSLPIGADVAGAVSWFDAPLANSDRFAAWAVSARADCPDAFSFIVLGEIGLRLDLKPDAIAAAYLSRLGLGWTGRSTLLGDFTWIGHHDPALLGYESDFVFQPGRYVALRALDQANVALGVTPAGAAGNAGIDLVVLRPPNAYVHQSATLDSDSRAAGQFWIIDPFELINRTLVRDRRAPIADVTTLNGKRLYFETVGPEGWLAPARARAFDEAPRFGSENLLSDLIAPFPDLPTTVSVVMGDLDPVIGGKPAVLGREVAERVFDLPQVAIATSGRSLVRYWDAIATASSKGGKPKVDLPPDESKQLIAVLGRNLRGAFGDPKGPTEPQLSDGLRQYGQDPFSLADETTEALKAVQMVTPQKQVAPLFLWSGDGKPNPDARAAVADAGFLALGGGGTALGPVASVSRLSPFALLDGRFTNVYHALPGDLGNLGYPNVDAHALHALGGIVAQTDQPRRLKPFQLAYSAGSANVFGTRSAITKLKRQAVAGETIPIFAARYVEIVQGFTTVQFIPEGTQSWRVLDRGALQTIRFDDAADLSVDLAASEGVLGALRINGALYIALDRGVVEPLISLTSNPSAAGMVVQQGRIGLVDSNLEIVTAMASACLTEFVVTGWGNGVMRVYGDPAALYRVKVNAGNDPDKEELLQEAEVVADAQGFAVIPVPTRLGQPETITLRQQCGG